MAIITHSSPATLQPIPCYNKHWFVSSSTETSQPNFKFRIVLTDILSGYTETHDVLPNPAGKLEFNAQFFAEKNMANFMPFNVFGWQKCAGATRKIRVNIGEYYTPIGYTPGSDIDYVTWNAAIDVRDFATYSPNSYCYDGTVPNYVYLTNTLTQKVFDNRTQFLYAIVQEGNTTDLPDIEINTFLANGTLVNSSTIARPDFSTGIYTDQYICIDIGVKGLLGLTAPQVAGSFPVLAGNESYYTITDSAVGVIKTIRIDCEPRFEVYTLHYLNRKGCYETLHCSKLTELSSEKNSYTAKKNVWTNVANVMTYDTNVPEERVQSVSVLDKIVVNCDWLTQAEITLHKDLFSSPSVYLDLGTSSYIPVKVNDKNYRSLNAERRRNLTFDLSYTNENQRQRG